MRSGKSKQANVCTLRLSCLCELSVSSYRACSTEKSRARVAMVSTTERVACAAVKIMDLYEVVSDKLSGDCRQATLLSYIGEARIFFESRELLTL